MNSKKCLWCSFTISEINGLRTLPEILTDHVAAAIRAAQINGDLPDDERRNTWEFNKI